MRMDSERKVISKQLLKVVQLFSDDAIYLDKCCREDQSADLPIAQVLASIECRLQRCAELIVQLREPWRK